MDINVLVVSVGNTRVALGVFSQGNLEYVRRVGIEQRDDLEGAIEEAWNRIKDIEGAEIAGASVNDRIALAVDGAVEVVTGQKVQWVGDKLDIPIAVKTEEPKETGIDRVLVVAAAYEQMQKACIVVDAGTAITVNYCDDKGNFVGGAIAPGARLMLNVLHDQTARLPDIELEVPQPGVGKNTQQAMLQGVYHSARGMVKELAEAYATELGNWPEIICTGGDAEVLFGGWELIHAVSPDLLLYGIAMAYANHYIKHG